jgi:hypothetical protein
MLGSNNIHKAPEPPGCRWVDNIKIHLHEEYMKPCNPAFVNIVMRILVP